MSALILTFALAASLSAAEAPKPVSYTSKTTVAVGDPGPKMEAPVAPALESGTADAELGPPAAVSPTAAAEASSPTAEPEVEEDDMMIKPTVLDLSQADTKLLSKISEAVKKEEAVLLFNLEEAAAVEKKGAGVAEISAEGLYMELAKRLQAGDRDAGKSLGLAIARGDLRARGAKDLAFEDKAANGFIKRFENGDKAAKAEIEKLAKKGNRRAREYLGLDKPKTEAAPVTATPKVDAPAPESGTAK